MARLSSSAFVLAPAAEHFILQLIKRVHKLFVRKKILFICRYDFFSRRSRRKAFSKLFWISPLIVLATLHTPNINIEWLFFEVNHSNLMIMFICRLLEAVEKIIHFFLLLFLPKP